MSFPLLPVSFVLFLELLCIVAVLFFERKNPGSSIAWILVLLFFPIVGIVAYLYLGTGYRVNRRKQYEFKAMADSLFNQTLKSALPLRDSLKFTAENPRLSRMIRYLSTAGESGFTANNEVRVYIDGTTLFQDILQDMRKATRHIHVLFYIIRNDALGRAMLAVLAEKARQGVEVRLMYDSLGSFAAPAKLFAELRAAGGQVQGFYPVRLFRLTQFRLNYRNHRKLIIVDGTIGYVGGMNVGTEYMGLNKKLTPWRDTHLRLTGTSVWFLQERFAMDWCYAATVDSKTMKVEKYFPAALPGGDVGIQIVSSGPDMETAPIKGGLMEILYAARRNIWIQTPYFTPDDAFLEALRAAARAGVDVRLMLPGKSDHQIVHWATLFYARQAHEAGVKVYAYNGFIHAKTIAFDGLAASIGTCNIGTRSFYLNFEITAFLYSKDFVAEQEALFLRDSENCTELTAEWFAKRKPLTRGMHNASRLLAPLM